MSPRGSERQKSDTEEAFRRRFFAHLLEACHRSVNPVDEPDVSRQAYDFRLGPRWSRAPVRRMRATLAHASARVGLSRRHFDLRQASETLEHIVEDLNGLARTYSLLTDERSRELLLDLVSFRVLGPRHVSLPVDPRWFWPACADVDRRMRLEGPAITGPAGFPLRRYAIPARGGSIELYGHPVQVVELFKLEQYAYRRCPDPIRADRGDVVIDGGGFGGETGLYFADAVDQTGKVLCVEFAAENLDLLRRNLELNERLRASIEVVPRALWGSSRQRLAYAGAGSMTTVAETAGVDETSVETESIDDLVGRLSLKRVDFLKLDIEGAELQALAGAEAVLRRFRPKLAVSVYHRPDDLITIPGYLADLDLGYQLYLDHFATGPRETVLFARSAS